MGGVAQGIGGSFFERMAYDADGQLRNASFMDFLMPYATEIPPMRLEHLETPSPLNPRGIKGRARPAASRYRRSRPRRSTTRSRNSTLPSGTCPSTRARSGPSSTRAGQVALRLGRTLAESCKEVNGCCASASTLGGPSRTSSPTTRPVRRDALREGPHDARQPGARRRCRASRAAGSTRRRRVPRARHDHRHERADRAQGARCGLLTTRGVPRRPRDHAHGPRVRLRPAVGEAAPARPAALLASRCPSACSTTAPSRLRSTRTPPRATIATLLDAGVEAIAVAAPALLREPGARAAAARAVAEAAPRSRVSISSDDQRRVPRVRAHEHDRGRRLRQAGDGALHRAPRPELQAGGLGPRPFLMQGSGGMVTAERATEQARSARSRPAPRRAPSPRPRSPRAPASPTSSPSTSAGRARTSR